MTDAVPTSPFFISTTDTSSSVIPLSMPSQDITINSVSGKKLVLSWAGNVVTISGDLPASEAAKVFLNALGIEVLARQSGCKADKEPQ